MQIKTTKQIQYMKLGENWAKKWVAVDDLISQLEDWNNNLGLNVSDIICKIEEISTEK